MIRILLVDDQTLFREGMRSLLEHAPNMVVVGEARDGDEALVSIEQHNPDVVLLDLRMPKKTGLEVLSALRQQERLLPIIVLTTFNDHDALVEALRQGARGYLQKDGSLEQLRQAIETVVKGGRFLPADLIDGLMDRVHAAPSSMGVAETGRLTERELEILRLLSSGFNNREMATMLELREGTIKNHISNILGKLRVRDRTQAVLKGLELRLI